jgi:hypothetical protein
MMAHRPTRVPPWLAAIGTVSLWLSMAAWCGLIWLNLYRLAGLHWGF